MLYIYQLNLNTKYLIKNIMKTKNQYIIEQFFMRRKKELSLDTKKRYIIDLNTYSNYNNMTLSDLIKEAKNEQLLRIVDNIIIEPDIENSKLAERLYSFIINERNRNIKDNTLKTRVSNIRTFYKAMGVKQLPLNLNFDEKGTVRNKLKKEKIIRGFNEANKSLKNIIAFMSCTGIRIKDCSSFLVDDYMRALKVNSIEELIKLDENSNIIGYWEFMPHKTKKNNIICKVCNDQFSNKLILKSLKERYDKTGLERDDYLFVNTIGEKYSPVNTQKNFQRIDKKLYFEDISYFKQLFDMGKIDRYSYEKEINNISKFHTHGLRHFFITQVANHCGNLRAVLTMEGHSSIVATDKTYVDISEETIRKEYLKLIPHISLENTKVNVLTDERIKMYENKLKQNELQNKERDERLEQLENFVRTLNEFNLDNVKSE